MRKSSPALRLILPVAGIGIFLAIARRSMSGPARNLSVPQPAKAVDLHRYLGRWYEIARYENRFERGCDGVTADYALRPDGLIAVVNACRKRSSRGVTRVATGRAKIISGSRNAKLRVSFFGPFFFGHYWVLDHGDDYEWSLVGEPSGRFLWILCRDPIPSAATFENLLNRARAMGYDTTRLRRTQQHPS